MSRETDDRLGPEIADALIAGHPFAAEGVSARAVSGVAILLGRQPSHETLGEIERAALGVLGVTGVANDVGIADTRTAGADAALAVALVHALALDRAVPVSRVKPIVRCGRVRLVGRVWRSADRRAAERCARRVGGSTRVANAIHVIGAGDAALGHEAVPR